MGTEPLGSAMLGFIKWLLGSDIAGDDNRRDGKEEPVIHPASLSREHRNSDIYFASMSRLQAAVSKRDYEGASRLVRENLKYVPQWVEETRRDYGSFDIRSIPALEQGGTMLALSGDEEGLAGMLEIVASLPELEPWIEEVERHQENLRLFKSIQELVAAQPNCLQTAVKGLIGEEDGRRVANLLTYLDKAGRIRRIKEGRTYRLLPLDSINIPAPPAKGIVRSHRARKNSRS